MPDNHSRGSPSRRDVLRGIGAVGSIAALGGVTAAQPGREPGPKPTELLVGTETTADTVSTQSTVEAALPSDANVVHRNETLGYFAVDVGDEARATADSSLARRLERTTGVAYVEENGTYYALDEPEPAQVQPNDPNFSQQYAPQQVNAPDAWEVTMGSSDVTIAVADTGCDYNHSDLQAQFGSDPGQDFTGSGDPSDGQGHGTHVAGIASATTDNGTGIAGMSNSHLLAVKVLGGGGGGSWSDIADGVQWAGDNGADIINMSLGGPQGSTTLRNAIDHARNQGALSIVAAGNTGNPNDVQYPAAYSNNVAVSALNSSEQLANFSSYGPEIDVAAPGAQVYSTLRGGGYGNKSGTSMACPAAAGVAALGKAVNPSWGPGELRQALQNTAADIGLPSDQQGNGRVDAANLVGDGEEPPPDEINAVADASSTVVDPGETVTFDASDSSGPINSYEWEFGDGNSASGETVTHSYRGEGEYTATLTVSGREGTDSDTVDITVDEEGEEPPGDCDDTPEYSNSTLYMAGDRAAYQGSIWEADVAVMTVPPSEGSYWWSHVSDC